MDILLLSTWFPSPPDNGSKLRVHHLLRALARRHQVTLLAFAFDTADPAGAVELRRACTGVEAVEIDPMGLLGAVALVGLLVFWASVTAVV